MFALEEYHKKNGSFPPAYVVDANGNPMHSWRAILLPYIDDPSPKYDLSEPWNSAKNSQSHSVDFVLLSQQPTTAEVYELSGGRQPNTAWPGKKPLKLSDLPDGGRHTIMLIETAKSGIEWTEPRNLTVEETRFRRFAAAHIQPVSRTWHVRTDAYTHSLSASQKRTLKTLLTVNGEKFPDDMHAFLNSIVLDSPPTPVPAGIASQPYGSWPFLTGC